MKRNILLICCLAMAPALYSRAEIIVALTAGNRLLSFDSAAPGTLLSVVGVKGLPAGETLLGIDYRPSTGGLYALGAQSRLYQVDPVTGAATAIGPAGAFTLSGTRFGFDFSPIAFDRIRVTSDADQNIRLNPNNGGLAGTDLNLQYAATDAHAGANPNVVGSAYTNSFAGALVTVLYAIDSNLDILALEDPTFNGTLRTIGPLGVNTSDQVGFDISAATGVFYASLTNGATPQLYTINQLSGAATLLGTIGAGNDTIVGIAVPSLSALRNIATRGRVGLGNDVLIGGCIIPGAASLTLVIRGIGPSLASAGISDALPDPVLTVYDRDGVQIAANDDWQSSPQAAQITASGLAPTNPLEPVFYGSVIPGSYTAIVSGKDNATGIALVEIYQLQ